MPYNELIKNFERIRAYMRDFYVYGFKSRGGFDEKSARSYDDERRRIESWLGGHTGFRRTPDGKNVFISIDSRSSRHDPLYNAWKAKSFTDGDITLHFILFDILYSPEISLTLNEITERIDGYIADFDDPMTFDQSTVRKKLNEYAAEGIIIKEKSGKSVRYSRTGEFGLPNVDALDFFSEVAPCGVIGSFLLDKSGKRGDRLAFKHHYVTGSIDSETALTFLDAIRERRFVMVKTDNLTKKRKEPICVLPLRIQISVQNGRQYAAAYCPDTGRMSAFRLDRVLEVKRGALCDQARFDELRSKLDSMQDHMWGVGTQSRSGSRMEHVEFSVRFDDSEEYIYRRLEREKRCGKVERTGKNSARFTADVYDSSELVPWIRTFICRITDLSFSDKQLEAGFKRDLEETYRLYGIE